MTMLAFDAQGDGSISVALLHGVGGGRSIWADGVSGTASALAAAGFRTYALDLPGYGESALPPGLTTASMAEAVASTLRAQGVQRAVLLGHSMGGMVAQELAELQPAFVQGLVLACTSPAFGKPGGDWQQGFLRERLAPLDAGEGMPALARRMVPLMVAPGTPQSAIARAVGVMEQVSEATYRAALAAIVSFDRRASLPHIAVPTLCLAAESDRTAPPDVMQRMAQRISAAQYACIAGAGHIANVEQPASFNAAVVDFLTPHFNRHLNQDGS